MAQLIRREESSKTCYGVSGKGHLIIDDPLFPWERIDSFLKKEWKKGLPVIAEPWVQRILDFSTQWLIDKHEHLSYIGSTLCANDEKGQYRYNQVGDEKQLFGSHLSFLKEHLKIAEPILLKIAQLGFFGNVGIDAMLYCGRHETWNLDRAKAPGFNDRKRVHIPDIDPFAIVESRELSRGSKSKFQADRSIYTLPDNIVALHPIVEINARKTMGWAALAFQRRYYPDHIVRFSYSPNTNGYLPQSVISKTGKIFPFNRNLTIDIYN